MNVKPALAFITSVVWLFTGTHTRAGSISGTINAEWFFPPAIFEPLSLPAVQSIDSISLELAHTNGNDFVIYLDAAAVEGEADFDLMFQEPGDVSDIYSMGNAPADGTLANVATYTFLPQGSGGGEYTVPHVPPGAFDANAWLKGPLAAGDYTLVVGDVGFLNGGAVGTWTIHYTPLPSIPADINGDSVVNVLDLLEVIGAWGDCSAPPELCPADINGDGTVNVLDLLLVISNWD